MFLLLHLLISSGLNGQWQHTAPLANSEYVYCLTQTVVAQQSSITYYQYAGTDKGVFISDNYGDSWTQFKNGLSASDPSILSIAAKGLEIYSGGYGGIYISTNGGGLWTPMADYSRGFIGAGVTSIAYNGALLMAATSSSGFYITTDKGNSWQAMNTGFPSPPPWIYSLITVNRSNVLYFYAATGNGVYVSPNNGTNWYKAGTGIPESTIINSICAMNNIFLAGTANGLYRSADWGATWGKVAGAPVYSFSSFVVYGKYIFGGTSYGVYISSDGGNTWNSITGNIPTNASNIMSVAVLGNYLLAGTYQGGVWRRPLAGLVSNEKKGIEIPAGYALAQNYPNPFNPSTEIRYSIPALGDNSGLQHIIIKVYDILGREAARVVDEYQSPGVYSVRFNGGNLSSGIYFYILEAGKESFVKKMILLK